MLKATHQREDEQNHHKGMEKLPGLQNSEGRVNIFFKKSGREGVSQPLKIQKKKSLCKSGLEGWNPGP